VRRTGPFGRRLRDLRVKQVVLSGGVLGTVPLLLKCKERGLLPALSERLGDYVRTNSEAIVGALSRSGESDNSRGIAITSAFYPEPHTHVEIVRYGAGQDAIRVRGSGPLYLGVNDDVLDDNGGEFRVTVSY
jgi:cholesterol oxidase